MGGALAAAWAGARAILKVAIVCGAGGVAFKLGVFDLKTSKVMSNMFIKLFLPALIFSKTAVAITEDNAPFLGILSTFSLGYFFLGHLVGLALYFALRRLMPVHLRRSLIPATAFGNHGDLVLSIILSLAGTPPFRDGDVDRGVAYVSVWYSLFNLLFYGIGIKCFERDFADFAREEDAARGADKVDLDCVAVGEDGAGVGNVALAGRASTRDDYDEDEDSDDAASSKNSIVRYRAASSAASPPLLAPPSVNSTAPPRWPRVHRAWSAVARGWARANENPVVRSLLLPPNIGLALGLLVALTPLKSLLMPASAPLSFVYDAANFIGAAAIPVSMTIFGAALTTVETDRRALVSNPGLLWSTGLICVYRMVLMPVIGIAAVTWATDAGWVPLDQPMLRFVLMVEACVPTAQICILITQYFHPRGESKEIATIMIAQYALSFITLTASLGYIFNVLETTTPPVFAGL
ncbi:hypothetical protein H9P43_008752 [Blastocladiella emersonii ATCC 22665]|nr:hypothetical protein H9P43_008752 [Blastocladiella emersonii ATCC 22665]